MQITQMAVGALLAGTGIAHAATGNVFVGAFCAAVGIFMAVMAAAMYQLRHHP